MSFYKYTPLFHRKISQVHPDPPTKMAIISGIPLILLFWSLLTLNSEIIL